MWPRSQGYTLGINSSLTRELTNRVFFLSLISVISFCQGDSRTNPSLAVESTCSPPSLSIARAAYQLSHLVPGRSTHLSLLEATTVEGISPETSDQHQPFAAHTGSKSGRPIHFLHALWGPNKRRLEMRSGEAEGACGGGFPGDLTQSFWDVSQNMG